ncbi:MAG: hypothetical protein ACTSRS_22400 [Candidatus Helarchaeota archaeon]
MSRIQEIKKSSRLILKIWNMKTPGQLISITASYPMMMLGM